MLVGIVVIFVFVLFFMLWVGVDFVVYLVLVGCVLVISVWFVG